ncbi:hypothetical protein MRX96_010552 [Rhipicephalus microplus]
MSAVAGFRPSTLPHCKPKPWTFSTVVRRRLSRAHNAQLGCKPAFQDRYERLREVCTRDRWETEQVARLARKRRGSDHMLRNLWRARTREGEEDVARARTNCV